MLRLERTSTVGHTGLRDLAGVDFTLSKGSGLLTGNASFGVRSDERLPAKEVLGHKEKRLMSVFPQGWWLVFGWFVEWKSIELNDSKSCHHSCSSCF